MKLRVGTLIKALGGLFGLFVGIPLGIVYATNVLPKGTLEIVLAATALLGTLGAWLRPDLRARWWGTSPAAGLLLTAALVCRAFEELHLAPESISRAVGWLGVALFAWFMFLPRLPRSHPMTPTGLGAMSTRHARIACTVALAAGLAAGATLAVTRQSVGTLMLSVGLLHVCTGFMLRARPELAGTMFGTSPLHNSLSGIGVAMLGVLMLHVVAGPAEILLGLASVVGMAAGTAVSLRDRRRNPLRR